MNLIEGSELQIDRVSELEKRVETLEGQLHRTIEAMTGLETRIIDLENPIV